MVYFIALVLAVVGHPGEAFLLAFAGAAFDAIKSA